MASIPRRFERFAEEGRDIEAVLQRLGADMFDLVLVDAVGNWDRAVLSDEAAARAFCEARRIPIHDGWGDPDVVRRMNALDAWSTPGAKRRAI